MMFTYSYGRSRPQTGFALALRPFLFLLMMRMSNPLWAGELDDSLRQLISQAGVGPLPALASSNADKVELGQLLFFDKELSGNRDTACASCHHPQLMTGDARSLPVGTAGKGLGPARGMGEGREFVPRNSPEIFHRGQQEWTTMFWDSRVSEYDGQFQSPAGDKLPPGLDSVLPVQAMFPVTSRTEMRGDPGDTDVNGAVNELAEIKDGDLKAIWQTLTNRLMGIPEYQQRFAEVYAEVAPEDFGFEHAANAIAAFEANAFAPTDSAWDRYLAGDDLALTDAAKRGAHVFFGDNCASCHAGSLMTDQEHHNIGVPQLGPGKIPDSRLDTGRAGETSQDADRFSFRTPPLRNVVATGPWMHNGAYTELDDAIRHYSDPTQAMQDYDVSQLEEALQATVLMDDETIAQIVSNLDSRVLSGASLTDDQVDDLTAFLFALTSPSIDMLPGVVPDLVPSGLPVDRLPDSPVSLLYNTITGELTVDAPADLSLSSLFLRLSEDVSFDFLLDEAAWSDDDAIILSDELRAQSFLEYRRDKPFRLHTGDSIGTLLPANLTQQDLDGYLSAIYIEGNNSVLWSAEVIALSGPAVGDFDMDELLTHVDIDLLSAAVRAGVDDATFDLDGDGEVAEQDRAVWIQELAGTLPGDADLNKTVELADFLILSDNFSQSGGWAHGDFNGDGQVSFPDFLSLSANFGRSNAFVETVPEPSCLVLAAAPILLVLQRKHRRRGREPQPSIGQVAEG